MRTVALTDTVTITYTAALESGELIEQATEPVTLSIGSSTVCPAVEACLFGMEPGQTRVIRVQPEDAYGCHLPELVQQIPLESFKGRLDPKPGMILALNAKQNGQTCKVPAMVVSVQDGMATMDYNHPLAGQVVIYTVTLLGISA